MCCLSAYTQNIKLEKCVFPCSEWIYVTRVLLEPTLSSVVFFPWVMSEREFQISQCLLEDISLQGFGILELAANACRRDFQISVWQDTVTLISKYHEKKFSMLLTQFIINNRIKWVAAQWLPFLKYKASYNAIRQIIKSSVSLTHKWFAEIW